MIEKRHIIDNATLMAEWDWDKNNTIGFMPHEITEHSGKKVWWVCPQGHSFESTVANRTNGKGCPYCLGHRIICGKNDFATLHPNLLKEWDTTKNGDLSPTMISPGSKKKVWWICQKGHEWQSAINSRTLQKLGCPTCRLERHTSFPEQAILFYCSQVTCAKSRYLAYGKEIDIYLPDLKTGVEYNGSFWHKNKREIDTQKADFLSRKSIRMITIAEEKQNIVCGDTIKYRYSSSNPTSLNWAIQHLLEILGFETIPVDVTKHSAEIYSRYIISEKENSLACQHPEIAQQWNHEKNRLLKPEMVLPRSNKKVWWKCHAGHEWQAVVSSRVCGTNGCPYCAGQKTLAGYNDLATTNPEISAEWDVTKNANLLPTMFSAGSRKKIWWLCPACKNTYQTEIYHRTGGKGCPYCSSRKIVPGFNDLATQNPELAGEWNIQKNGSLSPDMLSSHSSKVIWWKCALGHEWQASVANRSNGRGCPYCAGKKVLSGYNDLSTTNYALSLEWHPSKNGSLMPTMVSAGSHKKVWWICKNGHEWQARICNRTSNTACPICQKQKH